MAKPTIKQIKDATNKIAENFRISHGKHSISFPEEPTTIHGIKEADGYMILILADYQKKSTENFMVSKKTFATALAKAMGVDATREDFKADF